MRIHPDNKRDNDDDEQYIGTPDIGDKDAFCARVHGDSMEPEFGEGDIVVFSPAEPLADGDRCFIRFGNNHTTFKRLFRERDENGREVARLVPINQTYGAKTVPAADVTFYAVAISKYVHVRRGGAA